MTTEGNRLFGPTSGFTLEQCQATCDSDANCFAIQYKASANECQTYDLGHDFRADWQTSDWITFFKNDICWDWKTLGECQAACDSTSECHMVMTPSSTASLTEITDCCLKRLQVSFGVHLVSSDCF